jgi:N-acetylneuraminate lyase
METTMIRGILPALLTPMDEDGASVNHATLTRLVDFHIASGASGFFVCGGTGEGLLLRPPEREAVLKTVLEAARGRASVIAHIGTPDTSTACELAAHAAGLGVDAIAAVPPIYFKVDQDALVDHYRLIAAAAPDTPIYPYNIPSSTGVEISAAVMARLLEIPTVGGIKYSSYNLFDMRNIIELAPERLTVLSGFDEVCVAGLAMGAHGAIGSTYNIMPAAFSALYAAMQAGDIATAQELQFRANRVIAALLSAPLIAGLKAVLSQRGYDCGGPRRPQRPLVSEERQRLLDAVATAGLDELEAEAREQLARSL